MMPIQKGEFYVKVPITYFSDAFQDILARDGFFILWRFKKIFLEKKFYHVSQATIGYRQTKYEEF